MINYATNDVHMKAFKLLHSVGLISICILAFGMLVSLVVSTYLFGMNVWKTQVGFLSIREYRHCAFLMFSKCAVWISFNVNLCALLFTIELKLASFYSEYWNCAFLSFLSAGLCALVFITVSYRGLRVVIGPSCR